MTMIHALHDFAFENLFQFFQIQHHAGHRIRLALDGYFQRVIVPVAVRVIALSKDSTVLLSRKIRVVVDMRGGKLDFSREKNHGCSLILPIRELLRSTPGLSIGFFHLRGSGRTPRAQLHTAPRRVRNKKGRKKGKEYTRELDRDW